MGNELVPFQSNEPDTLELFKNNFMVPSNWKTCGPVVYISGAPGLSEAKPVAAALTKDALSLCNSEGPVWSLPLGAIQDVKVEDVTGVSFPIMTPSGITRMIPPSAKGVTVSFKLTPAGAAGRLILFTLSPDAAYEWVNDIQSAVHNHSLTTGKPEKR